MPASLNQGTDPIAQGVWVFPDLFTAGEATYVKFAPGGSVEGIGDTVAGFWSTDHNGLNQPPAAVFIAITRVDMNGAAKTVKARLNFSATPIAAADDGKATLTTYAPNTDNMTLNPTVKRLRSGVFGFQLFASTE